MASSNQAPAMLRCPRQRVAVLQGSVVSFHNSVFVTVDDPIMTDYERCPAYAPFFGAMGCAASMIFTVLGASYGTAKSSSAIFSSGILRPDRLMQNTLCAVMAQILAIYGLVAAVIIAGDLDEYMPLHQGFLQFGAGISVGLCGMAAGFAIGIIGDAGVRASTQQPRLYVGMVLILIFAEVLGLYGLIVCILMLTKSRQNVTVCRRSF